MHENTGASSASTTRAYDPRTLDQLRFGAELSLKEAVAWFEKTASDLRWYESQGDFRSAYGCFVSMCRPAGVGVAEAFVTLHKLDAHALGGADRAAEAMH